jgi:hypothetical protein
MNDKVLRYTSGAFLTALLVHGSDHLRRGIDLTSRTAVVGTLQFVAGVVAVALVYRRHRLAPKAAIAVGLPSALLFVVAHLLPPLGPFSDSFTGSPVAPGVTGFSWFAALFEIAADLAFGWAGVVVLRRRGTATARAGRPTARRSPAGNGEVAPPSFGSPA